MSKRSIFWNEKRHQSAKYFNSGRIGHHISDCRQGFPRNSISSGNDKNRRFQPSGLCRRCEKKKNDNGPMNVDQQGKTRKPINIV